MDLDKDRSPPVLASAASGPSAVATNVLFIGGLPPATTDAELMSLLGPYGALDCVTLRAAHGRSYAFILFRSVETARAAMNAAQGVAIHGGSMRIEMARPAKAVRYLWVGGISTAVSKEELEKEFSKFGKIEDFVFLSNRNSAMVDYVILEDAISAHKSLNGKVLGGEVLSVDFQRAPPSRREPVDQNLGGKGWGHEGIRGSRDPTNPETRRYTPQGEWRKQGNQPTNVLWIGYPPDVKIDEQLLHNAMILFGEIERIKCFPARRYAFVEFRSTDEARRAKEGLQGRLFNDPRIRIVFSSSGARPDFVSNEDSFAAGPPPFGRGYNEPEIPAWRGSGLPPGSGILPPPSSLRNDPVYSDRDRDPYDEREAKRIRWDDRYDRYPPDEQGYGNPVIRGGSSERRFSPGLRAYGEARGSPDDGSRWRGTIHKGGSFVCNARCVPIGHGLDFPLPHVVNCSARTDLETLTRHYYEGIGFDAVFFLPDSEADFASYTEFLQYLRLKNRAGVAKMYDGTTTLFLVPPSEFLTDVLGIRGPERLYGVVLHLPQVESPRPVLPQPVVQRPNSLDQDELRGAAQTGVSLTPELISSLQSLAPALATSNSISNGHINGHGERVGPHVSMNSGQLSFVPNNGIYVPNTVNVPGGQEVQNPAPYLSHQPYQPDNYSGYMNTPTRPSNSVPSYQPEVVPTATATSELDVEKNQRYQSTLQFAANLLLQIQQQQRQQAGGAAPSQ